MTQHWPPNAPYAALLKAGLLAVALLFAFGGGCSVQKDREAEKRTALEKRIDEKDAALTSAAEALRASGDALKRQSALNAERIAEAQRVAGQLQAGEQAAREALAAGEKRHAAERAAWQRARKAKPDCEALLTTDLLQVCGVMPK